MLAFHLTGPLSSTTGMEGWHSSVGLKMNFTSVDVLRPCVFSGIRQTCLSCSTDERWPRIRFELLLMHLWCHRKSQWRSCCLARLFLSMQRNTLHDHLGIIKEAYTNLVESFHTSANLESSVPCSNCRLAEMNWSTRPLVLAVTV